MPLYVLRLSNVFDILIIFYYKAIFISLIDLIGLITRQNNVIHRQTLSLVIIIILLIYIN